MDAKKKQTITTLFVLGLVFTFGAPFIYWLVNQLFMNAPDTLHLYHITSALLPSLLVGGAVLSAWGIALLVKS